MEPEQLIKPTLQEIQSFKGKYPKQLYTLFFAEMWERFTFYGMRALLILFMTKELLYSDDSANLKYGAYNAFIYAMGIFGGMFADQFLGSRRSILFGGIVMAIGSFVLVLPYEMTFYIGMGIIIVGNSFFKPNISTMVGQLYPEGDPRQDAGFSLFYSGINFGAFFGGLICGWIGETYSWHLGFGVAGVFMLFGLFAFYFGQRKLGPIGLPPSPEKLKQKYLLGLNTEQFIYVCSLAMIPLYVILLKHHSIVDYIFPPLFPIAVIAIILIARKESKVVLQKLLAALILIIFSALFWAFYEQGGGSMNLYADRNVDMTYIVTSQKTSLMTETHAGDSIICLNSTAKLQRNDNLSFQSGKQIESTATIDSILDNNKVKIKERLLFDWKPGIPVTKTKTLSAAAVNNAINPFYIILFSPLIGLIWVFLARRKLEPNTIVKFALGLILLGLGFYLFYWSKNTAGTDGRVALWIFAVAYFVMTLGELCLSPIGLSMVTKLSPLKMVGLMMGMWFLASAFGQWLAGKIGAMMAAGNEGSVKAGWNTLNIYTHGFYQIAWISMGCGLLLFLLSPLLKKWMHEVH